MFLDLIAFCANALLGVMSTDLTFWETSVPVVGSLYGIFTAVGWGLLIGNCAFQALKAMFAGLGFETESPAILLFRTALFGTLLIFSKDICNIGLSIGKNVMDLIGIPSSVTITTPDESAFSGLGASWLLVIIIGFILGIQLFKLFFEVAERYVVVAVLTLLCPVGLAMGGSKSTKDICTGFIRTYASMVVMMVLNVLFLKLILSALSTMPSGTLVLPWCLLVVGIAKTARKADNLVSKIGLSPAITGDPLGHGRGMMVAMMAARTIMNSASKAGKAKSSGRAGAGTSKAYTNNRNMSGGTNIGGSSVHNSGGASSTAEQSTASSSANTNSSAQNSQNMQNSQSSRFGAPNTTANTQSASSSRFGSVNHNSATSSGSVSGGVVHFSSGGNTQVNTNRFGSQPTTGMSGVRSTPKGASHPSIASGGKTGMQKGTAATGKTAAKGAPAAAGKSTKKSGGQQRQQPGGVPQKSARFGASAGKAQPTATGGLRQNANPFKKSGMPQPGQLRTNTPIPIQTESTDRSAVSSDQPVNDTPSVPKDGETNG